MHVKLVRISLKSDPSTILPINSKLGDIFEVVGYDSQMIMIDGFNKKKHQLSVYHILNEDGTTSMAPCELFEPVFDSN